MSLCFHYEPISFQFIWETFHHLKLIVIKWFTHLRNCLSHHKMKVNILFFHHFLAGTLLHNQQLFFLNYWAKDEKKITPTKTVKSNEKGRKGARFFRLKCREKTMAITTTYNCIVNVINSYSPLNSP